MKSAAWLAALLALPLDGAKYVEPLLCARCHAAIAESYARTGMARSFGAIRLGTHLAGLERVQDAVAALRRGLTANPQ